MPIKLLKILLVHVHVYQRAWESSVPYWVVCWHHCLYLNFGKCWLYEQQATTLVTRVGKKSFYTHFPPPHPCAMLTKHFHLTQVCILPFSNIERGDGGVGTYFVGITIIISCFWHFSTQFVQGCSIKIWNDEMPDLGMIGMFISAWCIHKVVR